HIDSTTPFDKVSSLRALFVHEKVVENERVGEDPEALIFSNVILISLRMRSRYEELKKTLLGEESEEEEGSDDAVSDALPWQHGLGNIQLTEEDTTYLLVKAIGTKDARSAGGKKSYRDEGDRKRRTRVMAESSRSPGLITSDTYVRGLYYSLVEDGDVDRKLDSKPSFKRSSSGNNKDESQMQDPCTLLVYINKRNGAQRGNSLRQRLNILLNPVQDTCPTSPSAKQTICKQRHSAYYIPFLLLRRRLSFNDQACS
ncbi:ARM repeat superfamily protein, partial [Prunus dulcis]